jgi:hypothetical protein
LGTSKQRHGVVQSLVATDYYFGSLRICSLPRGVVWGHLHHIGFALTYPCWLYTCRTNDGSSCTRMLTCVHAQQSATLGVFNWGQNTEVVHMRVTVPILAGPTASSVLAVRHSWISSACTASHENLPDDTSLTCTHI